MSSEELKESVTVVVYTGSSVVQTAAAASEPQHEVTK